MVEILSFGSGLLGIFIALPLLALRRQRAANVWIGLFVLSISLLSISSTAFLHRYPALFGLFDWPVTALGAFYYLYVRAMTGLTNGRQQAWHLAPLIIFILFILGQKLLPPLANIPFDFAAFLLACQFLAGAYALASLVRLHQFRLRLRENFSLLEDRDLAWLGWLTLVVIALLVIWIPATQMGGLWSWMLVLGRLTILYFVGWFGMRQPLIFIPELAATEKVLDATEEPSRDAPESSAPLGINKYARSGMTIAAQELIGVRLTRRMAQQHDHLENDLTLADLAERIGTSPQLLSQYLNNTLGVSFFDYVNGLRVAEVQQLMKAPEQAGATLLDLAHAAGFNSKSTFNAAFRKATGSTPSSWRRLHALAAEPISPDDPAPPSPTKSS